jgi:ABC-type methionine transport system ATPase subunit
MSVDALTSSYTNALLEPSPALTSDERSVPGDRPIVSLRNVSKRFDGARGTVEAVVDVSLDIARGEIFGIIGRSGAGKSTLVRCMNLLERPTSGSVVIDDVDLVALPPAALRGARRRIGMIFQHFNLLSSRTVYENVALPLELAGTDKRAIAARVPFLLELVGLADLANRYPAQVSGGQKQRIGIARALANEPKVLLSDEATSALDPETTRSILGLLADINRKLGLTIVLITHQMQVVQQVCERLAIGTLAAIVPLTVAATPFVGRIVENALREVDRGLIDAAHAMGATPRQIVTKVMIPEALPSIVGGLTITVVSLIGYSAMAGAIGGGGLGDLGIRYGYQRFLPEVMLAVVAVLIVLVQGVQWVGDRTARRVNHR